MNKGIALYILAVASYLCACVNTKSIQIEQGIKGQVLWLEGNQMPGPGKNPDTAKPVVREIFIYNAVKESDESGRPFYNDLDAKLITRVKSNTNGDFSVTLPAGTYSVFVEEEEGLFASSMDRNGILNPVMVNEDEVTEILILIDYKAAY